MINPFLGTSPAVFVGLTVVLFGFASFLTGQAVAEKWMSAWNLVPAAFGLGIGARFLTFALFSGPLLHLAGFLVQVAYLLVIGFVSTDGKMSSTDLADYVDSSLNDTLKRLEGARRPRACERARHGEPQQGDEGQRQERGKGGAVRQGLIADGEHQGQQDELGQPGKEQ